MSNFVNENSTIAELAARHNFLSGVTRDVKTLAKRGRLKMLAQIREMEEALENAKAAEEASIPDESSEVVSASVFDQLTKPSVLEAAKQAAPKKAKAAKKDKVVKEKGPSIRSVAEALLLEVTSHDDDGRPYGLTYDEILQTIRAQFEGAKTSVACLRWYAVHMRERGEKVPNRPRAQPAKKVDTQEEA